jgi:hypothetical protein
MTTQAENIAAIYYTVVIKEDSLKYCNKEGKAFMLFSYSDISFFKTSFTIGQSGDSGE